MVFSGMVLKATLKGVLKFVVDNWQTIAVAVLALTIFLYWNHRTTLIENQQTEITKLIGDKAKVEEQCRQEKKVLTDKIAEQNKAIEEFRARSEQNQTKINQAKDEVIKIQKQYNAEIRKILQSAKPEDCSAAIKYLVDAAGEFATAKEKTK